MCSVLHAARRMLRVVRNTPAVRSARRRCLRAEVAPVCLDVGTPSRRVGLPRIIKCNKQDATDAAASIRPAQHAMRNTQRKLCQGGLPPLARPVKSGLGPASRCVACHDALLVRVASAAVVCVACRLSPVACCRCADTVNAHESTPEQPPAARQYGSTPDGHGTAGR